MKILVIGSKGRMGSLLCEVARRSGHEAFGVDIDDRKKAEEVEAEVIVDFSSSTCLKENLELAKRKKLPIVVATTGHNEENLRLIEEYKEQNAVFVGSNLSILFNLLLKTAKSMEIPYESDVILEETHHKHKVDSPSGSAKELLNVLNYDKDKVKVISNRVGEVVGVHTLSIFLGHERLDITHTCQSREVFCEGTIRACEFMRDKTKGLFTMQDLLK